MKENEQNTQSVKQIESPSKTDTMLDTVARVDAVTRLRAQAMAFMEILRLYETETWIEKRQGLRYALEATAADILKHTEMLA